MKFRDEFRDAEAARACLRMIEKTVTRPWSIMEICGGQTHAILRYGLDQLLPDAITLIHGPGCPVCVTPTEVIDKAIDIARRPNVILCSFGDMLRVPGSEADLLQVKSTGGDVRIVYSPLDALAIAKTNPDRDTVFLAVGFETTAPANAMAAYQARADGLENFSMLVAHVLVPPAIEALLDGGNDHIDGFLAAGHVCTIMGTEEYQPLAERHRVPIVVTGFEPIDILTGVLHCIRQLESGRAEVENVYGRAVRTDGNPHARALMREVFEVQPKRWRGLGEIPASGLGLGPAYRDFDAEMRFGRADGRAVDQDVCIAGDILRGRKKPPDCPAFCKGCTPEHPLGVTMVSSEGACSAYYRYRRHAAKAVENAV
ncbi:MAG: hydrogenase formation protein HypD [Geminicoccaceae bacterium]